MTSRVRADRSLGLGLAWRLCLRAHQKVQGKDLECT